MRRFVRSIGEVARLYLILVVGLTLLLLILTVTGFLSPASPLLFGGEVLGIAIGMLLVILIFLMSDALQLLSARRRHLARRKGPGERSLGV